MSEEEIPTSVWSGSFMIGNVELKCHVLSDGRRIIESDGLCELFSGHIRANDAEITEEQVKDFAKWQRGIS